MTTFSADYRKNPQILASDQEQPKKFTPLAGTQDVALAAIRQHLAKNARALVCAGTGSGKTLIGLWAMEEFAPRLGLVVAPTIDLLKQLIVMYQTQRSRALPPEAYFAVTCQKVGADDIADGELPVAHTTCAEDLARFLRGKGGEKLVFSTYASAQVLVQACRQAKRSFDFAVLDEAHHLAGGTGKARCVLLDNDQIPIRKRLFFTATPRHVNLDKENQEEVFSMTDTKMFGERVYDLPLRQAIEAGLRLPFKVFVSVVPARQPVNLVRLGEFQKMEALALSLEQFVEKTGCRKILSKHATVAEGEAFAAFLARRPKLRGLGFRFDHINGKQPAKRRSAILEDLKDSRPVVLTYSECLNEGIDVPSVDAVCFMAVTRSVVAVVQAEGRAARIDRGNPFKKTSYVMLPAFAAVQEREEVKRVHLEATSHRNVAEILHCLCEADESLAQQIKEGAGRDAPAHVRAGGPLASRVEYIGDATLLRNIRVSVAGEITRALEGIDSREIRFAQWLKLYSAYVAVNNCNHVPVSYVDAGSGWALGAWYKYTKNRWAVLPEDHRRRLTAFGFEPTLNLHQDGFEKGLLALKNFFLQRGHGRVLPAYVDPKTGFKLGAFVALRRSGWNRIEPENQAKLLAAGFVLEPYESYFQECLIDFEQFIKENGHARVPKTYKSPRTGYAIGGWVHKLRAYWDDVPQGRKDQLLKAGFILDGLSHRRKSNIKAFEKFVKEHGHCKVPMKCINPELGTSLYLWLNKTRKGWNKLAREVKEKLLSLGVEPLAC